MSSFSGGDALERKLAEMAERLGEGKVLRVGFLENATYRDGQQQVAMVAAANEFGNPANNQPPRPFFRNMIADNKDTWPDEIGRIAQATGFDGEQTLGLMGTIIRGQLQQSIRELMEPPLSPVTIEKKGFDKPLIGTSNMLNSVDYDIRDGEE
ncbi:hypothetical protein [Atlantibacter hermannii]|uniref:hypothetical protein n=1 Tax=Atlantibacter hermannii TaxID=565 RepID=UPI0028AD270C|nr:hypothetical protein [Atlantibacter hermannii]